jgi:hypothetical protein
VITKADIAKAEELIDRLDSLERQLHEVEAEDIPVTSLGLFQRLTKKIPAQREELQEMLEELRELQAHH